MNDDEARKKLGELASAWGVVKLPMRPDKVPLSAWQKEMIKMWVHPAFTTSAKCGHCNEMYSVGYLKVCPANPEAFCMPKPVQYDLPKPQGFSDDELGYYFGITRDELDK